MKNFLHQFRWTLRRRCREIAGLFLLWGAFLFLPHRPDHMEDEIIANGAVILGSIAVLGVFLQIVMDNPSMGTNQFWRTRPVTAGMVLTVQLIMALVLLTPVIVAWAWQCWSVRDSVYFLPGVAAILIIGLAAASVVAASASFSKSRAQVIWVVPLAIGVGSVWWVALLNHGVIVILIGFIAMVLITATGLFWGKWIRRTVFGLAVLSPALLTPKNDTGYDRSRLAKQVDQYLPKILLEKATLTVHDEQGRFLNVLPPSTGYLAPSGIAIPIAEQFFAVLPIPTDYPAIKAQLGLPAETRWYEIPTERNRGELKMGNAWPQVWKVLSRQRRPLSLGMELTALGERSSFSEIRNEEEQIVVTCSRWRTVAQKITQRQYFLYAPTRSLVIQAGDQLDLVEQQSWISILMDRTKTKLTFYLPPAELLTGGPWRNEEISSMEIITATSRPCHSPKPLEDTPRARKEQLQHLAHALQQLGPPRTDFRLKEENDLPQPFVDAYGKAGVTTLLEAPAAPYTYYGDLSRRLFDAFSNEELVPYAARDVGWFETIAYEKPSVPLGKVARDHLRAGAQPEIELLKFVLREVRADDYSLISNTLTNLNEESLRRIGRESIWEDLVKLPASVYQPATRMLWKRLQGKFCDPEFTRAAAISGEIEALDALVLLDAQSIYSPRNKAHKVDQDLRLLVPQAPPEVDHFFKWYVENRSQLTWDAATSIYTRPSLPSPN